MNLKQFLKPDWRKIILLIVLLFIFILAFPYNLPIADSYSRLRGLPFPVMFLCKMGFCCNYLCCNDDYSYCKEGWQVIPLTKFLILGVIIDVIFWYLISCLIIWIFDKIKKKV